MMFNKNILLIAITGLLLGACSPDATDIAEDKSVAEDHGHAHTDSATHHDEDHHDHGEGEHSHDGDHEHEHAPATEAFYGDEAETATSTNASGTMSSYAHSSAVPEHSHEGEHEHNHAH